MCVCLQTRYLVSLKLRTQDVVAAAEPNLSLNARTESCESYCAQTPADEDLSNSSFNVMLP